MLREELLPSLLQEDTQGYPEPRASCTLGGETCLPGEKTISAQHPASTASNRLSTGTAQIPSLEIPGGRRHDTQETACGGPTWCPYLEGEALVPQGPGLLRAKSNIPRQPGSQFAVGEGLLHPLKPGARRPDRCPHIRGEALEPSGPGVQRARGNIPMKGPVQRPDPGVADYPLTRGMRAPRRCPQMKGEKGKGKWLFPPMAGIYTCPDGNKLTIPVQLTSSRGTARLRGVDAGNEGGYVSCLYSVVYDYTDLETADGAYSGSYETVMRVNIPCSLATTATYIGLVLLLPGGTSDAPQAVEDTTDDKVDLPAAYLASGKMPEVEDPGRPGPVSFGRTGDPAYTVALTYPGRGSGSMQGTGHPYHLANPTDVNTTGQDFFGPLTVAAAVVVVDLAYDLMTSVESARGTSLAIPSDVRLVLASFSAGVVVAANFLSQTTQTVHALVDTEGPVDSMDVTGAYNFYDPWDQVGGPLESEFNFEVWQDSDYMNCEGLYMRPPLEVLDGLRVYFGGMTGLVRLPRRSCGGSPFKAWYRNDMLVGDYIGMVEDFWYERTAADALTRGLSSGIGYLRIQALDDHWAPDMYLNYHAIKALNAAFASGSGSVFYVDSNYIDYGFSGTYSPIQVNTPFSTTFDPSWPRWQPDFSKKGIWIPRVDMVRWALQTDFA